MIGATDVDLVADSHGIVSVDDLPTGNYKIIVSSLGFADNIIPSITITSGNRKDLEIKLEQALPNPFVIHSYQTLEPHAYSKFLEVMKEPEFCKQPIPEHTQSYRFMWLPTFEHPVFMRVNVQQDGTALLQVKILSGEGGYDWGHVQTNTTRRLSADEEATLFTTLADIGFWNLPARVEFKDPFHTILDGTEWAIEGVRDGDCHAVARYSSPLTTLISQYLLGDVAKLKAYDKAAQ